MVKQAHLKPEKHVKMALHLEEPDCQKMKSHEIQNENSHEIQNENMNANTKASGILKNVNGMMAELLRPLQGQFPSSIFEHISLLMKKMTYQEKSCFKPLFG